MKMRLLQVIPCRPAFWFENRTVFSGRRAGVKRAPVFLTRQLKDLLGVTHSKSLVSCFDAHHRVREAYSDHSSFVHFAEIVRDTPECLGFVGGQNYSS